MIGKRPETEGGSYLSAEGGFSCVLGMLSSLEVKVLCPT